MKNGNVNGAKHNIDDEGHMTKYDFYYDESEHSRKINTKTITADGYYDNFVAVITGFNSNAKKFVFEKYIAFEEKHQHRKSSTGELKSQTLRPTQFNHGFASMNRFNTAFLKDFFSIFDEDILIYFSVVSKVEFIINQIFRNYQNSAFYDMDAMKYSIVKAIIVYKPIEIIEGAFGNTGEFVELLKAFFVKRIQKNELNKSLKERETKAFQEILFVLDDLDGVDTIEWDYSFVFEGFDKYLKEKAISDFTLTLDKEGDSENTLNAAKRVGFSAALEEDSVLSVGIRISDMLAGVLAKLLKALHNGLIYESPEEEMRKKLLSKEWFLLKPEQLELYKTFYVIVCKLNNAWYKTYSARYSDDLIVLIALLNYMNQFNSIDEIKERDAEMHCEYFNAYACESLSDFYDQMRNKLPLDPISIDAKDYFFNQRGAKVFTNISRQPLLKIENGHCKYNVLSVGFSKEGTPLATISEREGVFCYRLPSDLRGWAMTVVGLSNMGENLFPSEVIFSKQKNRYYADIL